MSEKLAVNQAQGCSIEELPAISYQSPPNSMSGASGASGASGPSGASGASGPNALNINHPQFT